MTSSSEDLQAVVDAVQRLLSRDIGFKEYLRLVPEDTDDEDVAEVLDLVEHMPKRGGVLGVSQQKYDDYRGRVDAAVARLATRIADGEP